MRKKPARAYHKKKAALKTTRASTLTLPAGYSRRPGSSLIVPASTELVSPTNLRKGLAGLRTRARDVVDGLVDELDERFEVVEIELQASFSADGKFMGFGVGGATTVTIKVRPRSESA